MNIVKFYEKLKILFLLAIRSKRISISIFGKVVTAAFGIRFCCMYFGIFTDTLSGSEVAPHVGTCRYVVTINFFLRYVSKINFLKNINDNYNFKFLVIFKDIF